MRANGKRSTRNVTTTSANERTDTTSLPRTGNTATNEHDRTNARGITTRASLKRTTRNVTTKSADERTDTTSLPRTGNTATNEHDRTNARGITTRARQKRTTRNVTTKSADERTDTTSLPRTGNTATNEHLRPAERPRMSQHWPLCVHPELELSTTWLPHWKTLNAQPAHRYVRRQRSLIAVTPG